MDVVDKSTRSRMMSGIRGKDTKPELIVRRFLHRAGLRFRLHARLPGKPDLAFPKYRTVVFVHGCFWHRHGCRFTATPSTRTAFWQKKFEANTARDAGVRQQLAEQCWRVLVLWECEIGDPSLKNLVADIKGSDDGGDERLVVLHRTGQSVRPVARQRSH
ncbi:MAG: DNA mismatch endonuclease Vsr [Proteobacteria bacterium]|nr:DNA mismatch endonuclease Vsr [Pseudomonadota bacterium]